MTHVGVEHLRVGVARAVEEETELADLRSKICRLQNETLSLCMECDRAHGDVDRLGDKGSQLEETLRGVKSRVGLAESSSREAEVHLVQAGSEL
jgi:hypothetical protein